MAALVVASSMPGKDTFTYPSGALTSSFPFPLNSSSLFFVAWGKSKCQKQGYSVYIVDSFHIFRCFIINVFRPIRRHPDWCRHLSINHFQVRTVGNSQYRLPIREDWERNTCLKLIIADSDGNRFETSITSIYDATCKRIGTIFQLLYYCFLSISCKAYTNSYHHWMFSLYIYMAYDFLRNHVLQLGPTMFR